MNGQHWGRQSGHRQPQDRLLRHLDHTCSILSVKYKPQTTIQRKSNIHVVKTHVKQMHWSTSALQVLQLLWYISPPLHSTNITFITEDKTDGAHPTCTREATEMRLDSVRIGSKADCRGMCFVKYSRDKKQAERCTYVCNIYIPYIIYYVYTLD